MPRKTPLLPLEVRRPLRKLGSDLRSARIRRRLTAAMVAERAYISSPTLRRVERGDASVALGIYATVLWVLGMSQRIGTLADLGSDELGLAMEEERLPKRVVLPRRKESKALLPDE
jgi:transcriptional regulator with XRE-family HTH domain